MIEEAHGSRPYRSSRRSGDKGGDKFGGLTCHKPKPRRAAALRARSSAGCRAAENPGNWAAFAHFFDPKASGDKAEANGDKLSGMEFACFSGQNPISTENERRWRLRHHI